MLTKGAIGNLANRYRAVLKKCNLINTFGSLAVASMLLYLLFMHWCPFGHHSLQEAFLAPATECLRALAASVTPGCS